MSDSYKKIAAEIDKIDGKLENVEESRKQEIKDLQTIIAYQKEVKSL